MKVCLSHVKLLIAVITAGTAGMLAPAVQAQGRAAIAGSHPKWANASRRTAQAPAATGAVSVRVYLAGKDPDGLAAYATAVSSPDNALYGQYLVRRAKARFSSGCESRPATIVPAGSNRSSRGSNEAAEAFGEEDHIVIWQVCRP